MGSAIRRWHSSVVPPEAAAFAREVVAMAGPASKARAKALLFAASRLGAFALGAGLELRPDVVFSPAVVERFIVTNAKVLSRPDPPDAAHQLPGARPCPGGLPRPRCQSPCPGKGQNPLTPKRKSAPSWLWPTPSRRRRGPTRPTALICLGAGAGLAGADLRALRGSDVRERSGGVVVAVTGRRARTVPVLARYRSRLLGCAELAGEGLARRGLQPRAPQRHDAGGGLARRWGGPAPLGGSPAAGHVAGRSGGRHRAAGVHGRRRGQLLPAPGRHRGPPAKSQRGRGGGPPRGAGAEAPEGRLGRLEELVDASGAAS